MQRLQSAEPERGTPRKREKVVLFEKGYKGLQKVTFSRTALSFELKCQKLKCQKVDKP